jgi:hypothetical protein
VIFKFLAFAEEIKEHERETGRSFIISENSAQTKSLRTASSSFKTELIVLLSITLHKKK